MGLFGNKSASLTWNSKGECFGVLMVKEGQKYKVVNHWYEKSSSVDNISPVIQKGYSALGTAENDFVIVGEMGMKCSFADFEQPLMNPRDMKKSLGFSLSSHFPMDPADLQWSYRILDDKKTSGLVNVRLIAMKKKIWNDWLDHIGTVKVDQIISPAAVCDSVIKDPVYIPFNQEKGFILSLNEEGKLQSKSVSEDSVDGDIFGAGEYPLEHDLIDTSSMDDLDPGLQQKFTQSILLSLYGLSPYLSKDNETAFETPRTLIPKRNVIIKTLCGGLAIFLLMLGIFQGSRIMAFKKREAAEIEFKINQLKKEAKMNMVDSSVLKDLTDLHTEMTVKVEKPVSAKDVLVVITETLPDDFYLTNFSLKGDRITCKIMQSNTERDWEDLYDIFKKDSFFDKDVLLTRGTKDISLTLKLAAPTVPEKEEKQ